MYDFQQIIHKADEFKNLPWDKLDPEKCSRDWSFGRGGHGFHDETYTVSIPRDKDGFIWDIWELPAPLSAMFKMRETCDIADTQRKIRNAIMNALGIE